MKTFKNVVLLGVTGALVGACGAYKKNPVSDLGDLHEIYGKTQADLEHRNELERQKQLENQAILERARQRSQEAPHVVEKEVLVEHEKAVPVEQATVDEKYIVIAAEEDITFIEGETAVFPISVRTLVEGLKVNLIAENLPAGAKLEKVSGDGRQDLYNVTWTPALYIVPANKVYKKMKFQLTAQVIEAPAGKSQAAIQKLMKKTHAYIFVARTQAPPKDLALEGLENEVAEGTITQFSVTVHVPGVDDRAPYKPTLNVSTDGQSYSAGAEQLEQDGSYHVNNDTNPQYQGDFKWKFNLAFDTKNKRVLPAKAKDESILPNAEYTAVRMQFKVVSPFGATSTPLLKQMKIKLTPGGAR